jgi:hypothetical protein
MTQKLSADAMISRIYNMTRGMVSPKFAKSEMKTKKVSTPRGGATSRKMGGKIPAKKKK